MHACKRTNNSQRNKKKIFNLYSKYLLTIHLREEIGRRVSEN